MFYVGGSRQLGQVIISFEVVSWYSIFYKRYILSSYINNTLCMDYIICQLYKKTHHIGSPPQNLQLPTQGACYHQYRTLTTCI